jgi:hypothetical protein
MSKSLRSYKNIPEREAVVARRLKEKRGGIGYLAAVDYKKKVG